MNLTSTYNQILNEGKIDVLKQQYINKPVKNQKQQNISEEDFNLIVAADPSNNYQYLQWLLNLYFWSQLKLEDLYKATEYLTVFDKFKSKIQEKDINKKTENGYYYDSLQTLFSVVQPFIEAAPEDNMSDNALNNKIKKEESEKVYEDNEWLIVVPKTKRASCLYGKGTQWCTAADKSENAFDQYNKEGKLYININKKTGKKYQFHFETNSFMDENDEFTDILFLNDSLLIIYDKLGKLGLITSLNLDKSQISQLPKSIGNLTNLKYLNLKNNNLTELPASVALFTNLENLDLENNNLTDLPASVALLTNLEHLDLSNNKLTELPALVALLTNLKYLYLAKNKLTELPASVASLTNLEFLDLADNQLTDLPPSIASLTHLERLDLAYNQLTELPASIALLTNLEYLDLSNNNLTELPAAVASLTNLKSLDLTNNKLTKQEQNRIESLLPNCSCYF